MVYNYFEPSKIVFLKLLCIMLLYLYSINNFKSSFVQLHLTTIYFANINLLPSITFPSFSVGFKSDFQSYEGMLVSEFSSSFNSTSHKENIG